ncbi:unnamed protein product [Arctogadus glacialis]
MVKLSGSWESHNSEASECEHEQMEEQLHCTRYWDKCVYAQLTIQDASLLNVPSFVSQPQPSQSLPQQSRAEGPAVDPNWHYR